MCTLLEGWPIGGMCSTLPIKIRKQNFSMSQSCQLTTSFKDLSCQKRGLTMHIRLSNTFPHAQSCLSCRDAKNPNMQRNIMQMEKLEPKTSQMSADNMLAHHQSQKFKLLEKRSDNTYQVFQQKSLNVEAFKQMASNYSASDHFH